MRHVLTCAVLMLGTLLAGCLADDAKDEMDGTAGPGGSVAARLGLAFGEPIFVGAQGDAESTVLAGPDGLILVCSHGGFWQPSPLWASTDGGASFRRIDPQPNPLVSGDCDLAVMDDGRWLIVYDTIASATVAGSDDEGASWDLQYASALPIKVDRPWIAAAGDEVYLTYANVMAAEPAIQMFARSTDGGRTFLEHNVIHIAEPPDRLQAVIGKMALSDDGQTIHVPLARSNIQLGGPLYLDMALSRDAGRTWSLSTVHGPYDAGGLVLPSITWAGERLYYVIPQGNGTRNDIAVMWNDAGGEAAAWQGPATVTVDVDFPQVVGPWIDGRSDGTATIAWIGQVEAGWSAFAVRVDGGEAGDVVMLAEPTPRGQGIGHEFLMVDHDPDGRAVVAWVMNTGDDCDPAPNPLEGRGSQCTYVGIEAAP